MSDISFAGDFFAILPQSSAPLLVTIVNYEYDRERYQKTYSYARQKPILADRVLNNPDDPALPGSD